MEESSDITKRMRAEDAAAFRWVARHHNAYILVRETNEESIGYINSPGFTPKRLDCKFKTATKSFHHKGINKYLNVAGLVVNPLMDNEFFQAFKKPNKFIESCDIWRNYHKQVVHDSFSHDEQGRANYVYFAPKLYTVNSDPNSDRYGCLMFSSCSLLSGASFIHGDYDLFGIVPADNPSENISVNEKRLGYDHSRGRLFFDVQHSLHKKMGVAMIQHGSQEKYTTDMNDAIDVFFPDGDTVKYYKGESAIKALYKDLFQGRVMYTNTNNTKKLIGDWVSIVSG